MQGFFLVRCVFIFAFSLSVWDSHLGQTKRLSLFLLIASVYFLISSSFIFMPPYMVGDHILILPQTRCLRVHLSVLFKKFRNCLDPQATLKVFGSLFWKTRKNNNNNNSIGVQFLLTLTNSCQVCHEEFRVMHCNVKKHVMVCTGTTAYEHSSSAA